MSAFTKQSLIELFLSKLDNSDLVIERYAENEFCICGSEVNHNFLIHDDDVCMSVNGDNPMNNYSEYISHSDAAAHLF